MTDSATRSPCTPAALVAEVGRPLGVSRWYGIPQERIDAFAEVTQDRQFIHLDAARAAQTHFGGTVAHGFLSLSMLSVMSYDVLPEIVGAGMSVNYGFDRLRFVSPVRAGQRIRGHFGLAEATETDARLDLTLDVTVEIDGADRPALVALWRVVFPKT